ncbi:tRNA epoxyqueuosine(34) reductase QueG [Candidatus Synechococcus calcipolaris G9]|uniref:Epoxyqueuosine reductase n=1 Tax=Candidatus Synechococcus calcipolaris G9 TaxID=1497997 RepID=A0ABT6EXV2_9SYNE|nr:tRNA epoxyqueuosine(34) reductase QueG [Candidatus Synechococcus calcipolaris]MDG2990202.1 tRNA epoxyqueuosine(34) reductase QueG [Candidatus Synechococcus calcipolaris G9]
MKHPALNASAVKAQARSLGFHRVGIVALGESASADLQSEHRSGPVALQEWLDQGYQADMDWMADPRRQDIHRVLPGVQSVIAVALNYYSPHSRADGPNHGKISRYAWGRDYHRVLTTRLKALAQWLHDQDSDIKTRYYVDTGPVQDKVWAERAGLGWIGKHSNLITRDYGSWVFLGELLTTLPLAGDRPHGEHCGTCRRCLDACPTQAITRPFVVDANRCIAYHTIENRAETLPASISDRLEGWVAGCDICQDVCPWNQRFAQPTDISDFEPYATNLAPSLQELAHLRDEDWHKRFPASALRRIKPAMWRRNAQANLNQVPTPE